MAIKTIRLSTKSDRAIAVDLLNIAHRLIENEQEHFVCSAVYQATHRTNHNHISAYAVSRRLRDKISKSLGNHAYVTDWLIGARRMNREKVLDQSQEYRKLWIKEMIAQNQD